jgi:tetratricopeptide (TPR) repeat protein
MWKAVLVAVLGLWLLFRLPRAFAASAFADGAWSKAARWYHLTGLLALSRGRRQAVRVSLAACALGAGDPELAGRRLAGVDAAALSSAARAAFLNLRAYLAVRGEPAGLASALTDADEAVRLRPEVPGFRHTRGLVYLGLGRLDEALEELDGMWRRMHGDQGGPLLAAERAYDLGRAWAARGEHEYARDYFQRAVQEAPGSPWAREAAARLL